MMGTEGQDDPVGLRGVHHLEWRLSKWVDSGVSPGIDRVGTLLGCYQISGAPFGHPFESEPRHFETATNDGPDLLCPFHATQNFPTADTSAKGDVGTDGHENARRLLVRHEERIDGT